MDIKGIDAGYINQLTDTAKTGSADKMQKSLQTDYSNASDEELMSVCKEFESYFLEQVFKEMKKTVPDTSGATGANKTLMDYYGDNMVQEMAKQSTEGNGLGLAQMLYEQMKRNISAQ